MKELNALVEYFLYWMVGECIVLKGRVEYFVYWMVNKGAEGLGEIIFVLYGE